MFACLSFLLIVTFVNFEECELFFREASHYRVPERGSPYRTYSFLRGETPEMYSLLEEGLDRANGYNSAEVKSAK